MKGGFYIIMAAQFFSSLADNALLVAAIALLLQLKAPEFLTPLLKLPATQIINRLQDLKYRVHALTKPAPLIECAEQSKPMLVLADLDGNQGEVLAAIARLKQHSATEHLPVIGFCQEATPQLHEAAKSAAVNLIATETAILSHLPQLLDQALQVD